MQWLIQSQQTFVFIGAIAVLSAILSGLAVSWWTKQKMRFQYQLLEQSSESEKKYLLSQYEQLQSQYAQCQQELEQLDIERDKAAINLKEIYGQLSAANEKLNYFDTVRRERQQLSQALDMAKEEIAQLRADNREQNARHQEESRSNQEKLQLLQDAEQRLKQEFTQLANSLFEEKSAKVDQQNKQSLQSLLSPLKEQLEGFKKQVTDSFGEEAKERHTLAYEIKSLQQLNQQMAKEAVNLTQALKGDNKQQGNWGEVVLARVLAESGLREGHEYQTQVSLQDEAGKRYQPDVIVHLPDNKEVVIDSKMALVAYERYFNAEHEEDKEQALSEHLLAIRTHIKGLSGKDYHQLKGIDSLDYVLMFIPVEPAFQLAIELDPSLVKDALENNIMIVSPTTLLVALRTIDNLWRNERQNDNAKVIADKASRLYDKLRLFLTDMEALGGALEKANQNYQGAINKLATGKGNVIRQAESFKALGVEVKRPIPSSMLETAENDRRLERHRAEDKVN